MQRRPSGRAQVQPTAVGDPRVARPQPARRGAGLSRRQTPGPVGIVVRDADLLAAVRQRDLSAALVSLDDLTVWGVTDAGVRLLGRPTASIIGRPIVDLVDAADRAGFLAALEAVRSGAVDFYRVHRRLPWASANSQRVVVWVRAIELDGRRYAFVAVGDTFGNRSRALVRGGNLPAMAVGTLDGNGIITSLSADATDSVGIVPGRLIGSHLLPDQGHRDQLRALLEADPGMGDGVSIAVPIRLSTLRGEERTLTLIVTTLARSADRLFILMEPGDATGWAGGATAQRVTELEQYLWRIATEVEASGILLNLGSRSVPNRVALPDSLSARQWEVLRRLVNGQRVPTIAAELFIAQSTVRNHLSAIFDRFGVHSQPELLALLAGTDGLST